MGLKYNVVEKKTKRIDRSEQRMRRMALTITITLESILTLTELDCLPWTLTKLDSDLIGMT